jgi:hypothetical protein
MPKTKISEFSATPANNTDIDSINIAEGCAPSGINDAIRELMAQLKDFQTGAVGDSFNGPVGTSTAAAGAFTTLSSTGNTTLGDASGDAITVNGTATFANVNPTLTAGTANGVTYLNGSKVLTSGSMLVFDSSDRFIVGAGSAAIGNRMEVVANTSSQAIGIRGRAADGGGIISWHANAASTEYARITADNTSALSFGIGSSGTERARIDTSGNLLVGTTSGIAKLHVLADAAAIDPVTISNSDSGTGSQYAIVFRRNTSTIVGSIQTTNTLTSYNTSSDYRLKNTIAPMTGALAKVALLKPVTYKWNADGSDGEGFIAHELAEVVPHAVTGDKDALDKDGNPKYQGIDVSFLVATLTAAIQEQQALITQLQADVATLKGN